MSGHKSSPIQIVSRVSGRRRWTLEQRLAILRDAFGPGGSVSRAMERHEVSSGALYTWRAKIRSGEWGGNAHQALPSFAEVSVSALASLSGASPIGIELPTGVRLSVDGSVDAAALSRVIDVLSR